MNALACGLVLLVGGCTLQFSGGDRNRELESSMRILLDHGYRIEHVNGVGIVIVPPVDAHASTLVVPDHFGSHTHAHLRNSDRHFQRTNHDRRRR